MTASLDPNTTPALMPPEGVVSNLVDPYTKQPMVVATATVCMALTTVCIGIRLYTKVAILKQLHVEDYLLVFAGLGFAAFSGVMIASSNAGQGKHQWDVSVAGLLRVVLLANILEILYGPVMFAAKAAVLLTLKRLFTGTQRSFVHWSFVTLIALNGLFSVSIFFAFVFACVPRAKITNPALPGTCISTNGSILATSATNILSDFSILFLPLFVVWTLQLPLKRKLTAGAIFATGLFACVSSVLRLYYSVLLTLTDDFTWVIAPVGMWALAEFATVILAGCFPVFPRFFKHIRNGGRTETAYADPYAKSHHANSFRAARQGSHGVYTETAMSAAPWGQCSSDDRVIAKGDYVELNDRSGSQGGYPVPAGARPGILKTVLIETKHSPKSEAA